MLNKVQDNIYLDGTKVNFAGRNEALAYLLRAYGGTDKNQSGFLTFSVKDINGYVIQARMFQVKDYLDKGFVLADMKKKPVRMEFTAGVWNGTLSIYLTNIEAWEGEFDHSKFMGRLPNAEELLTNTERNIGNATGLGVKINPSFINDSYTTICNGLTGGYAKFIKMVVNSVMEHIDSPMVVGKELMLCTVLSLSQYAKYLQLTEKLDVPMQHELLNLAYTSVHSLQDERLKNICVETMCALMGIGSPTHLYSHIVYKAIKTTENLLALTYEYPLVMEGSTKKIEGESLSRY